MTEAPADPRRLEWLPLDELVPDPSNPKDHDDAAISASVDRFGMIDIIARDDRTGRIVSGHGRATALRAAHAAGAEPPDGVRVTADGTWLAPVVTGWASEDDLAAEGALIALNQTTILGGWVDDQLLTLLDRLRDADQLAVTGIPETELEVLRRKLEAEGVFSVGTEHMLDEFRAASDQNEGHGYAARFTQKVVVYLRDEAAVEDFKTKLGLSTLAADLDLPLGWSRNG